MNAEQAQLLVKVYNHVLGLGGKPMSSFGVDWRDPLMPVCFVCEMRRAGLVTFDELASGAGYPGWPGMDEFFGITSDERSSITTGDYTNGYECAEAVKALLEKYGYGHLLNEPEESIKDQSWYPRLFKDDLIDEGVSCERR